MRLPLTAARARTAERPINGSDVLTANCAMTVWRWAWRSTASCLSDTSAKAMQATSIRRLLSYDMGAMFCSNEKASTLSLVATRACRGQGRQLVETNTVAEWGIR